MALSTGATYKTTTLASVYTISTSNDVTNVGYIEIGTEVTFSETKKVGSSTYGRINKSGVNYKVRGQNATRSANQLWLIENSVVQMTNGFEDGSTVNKRTGETINFQAETLLSPVTYKVNSGKSTVTYSGPSVYAPTVGSLGSDQTFTVYATAKSAEGGTYGAIDTGRTQWVMLKGSNGVLLTNFTETGTKTDNENASAVDTKTDSMAALQDMIDNTATLAANTTFSDESLNGLHNMQYVIGIPPYITRAADPQYMKNSSPSNVFGRCYTEMYMMGNTVFSIQPLKVKYLPGFNDEQRGYFYNAIANAVDSLGDDDGIEGSLTGQLFEGVPDYQDYINTVNLLARTMAVYIGIGDKTYRTGTKYKNMDYSWYKIRDNSHRTQGDGSLFATITSPIRWAADKLVTSAINDDTYMHFYMTADGTSINESMSVSTKSSSLESLFNNNLSSIAQEIQFLTGAESGIYFSNALADVVSSVGSTAGSFSKTLGNLVMYGANYLNGGRLVFPQMLDDCNYDRSYSGSCRFVSPSGDPEAIFLNCYLPVAYLLPYVLPQMLSDNMYKYPFLARIDAHGLFHSDLAAITNLRIQRGGQDGTAWTNDGLPFEIDVSFDVTPLYSKLMVTSARHPILYLSNSALQEYLGAICGVSFTGDQFQLKLNILKTLFGNYLTDTIPSMLRGYYSSTPAEWLRKFFNF